MRLLDRLLGSLEARLSQPWLNLWRTIYFNFRTLPYKQAVRFPIYIYGGHKFFMLNGNVAITASHIKRGMIKIGVNGDSFSLYDGSGYIQIANKKSVIEFQGPCRIALNTKIRVVSGRIVFGTHARIGSDSRIICNGGRVSIGSFTGVTLGCQIINSGFHYIYDANRKGYLNRTKDITIGPYNWIGNNATVSGGTVTNEKTIVCQRSVLNKDYSGVPIPSMLGGMPAKVVRTGLYRVFAPEVEVRVSKLFANDANVGDFVSHDEYADDASSLIIEM